MDNSDIYFKKIMPLFRHFNGIFNTFLQTFLIILCILNKNKSFLLKNIRRTNIIIDSNIKIKNMTFSVILPHLREKRIN